MPTFYLYPLLMSHAFFLGVAFVSVVSYRLFELHPAVVACVAIMAYSLILILFLNKFFRRVQQEQTVNDVLAGQGLSTPTTERWFRLINKPAASWSRS